MIIVIVPHPEQIAHAVSAIADFAVVVVPWTRGEIDRVAGVVHGHVDVEVALMLVGGRALRAGRRLVGKRDEIGLGTGVPVSACEFVRFLVGARQERGG